MDDAAGRLRRAGLGPAALWLAPPWLLGAALRLWGVPRQVVAGDEVHGVTTAVQRTLPEILTTYRLADHCIPLSSYYHSLMASGVGLTELLARLPALLSGLALLVALPLAGRRAATATDWRRAAVLAWLAAISPSLIYYGRIARPYAVVALLGPLAAAAFWRWWRGGSHRWGALYVAAAAGSAWFHLGTAPFVAAPLLYGAGDLVRRRLRPGTEGRGRGAGALILAGLGLAAGVAAFLLPARRSFERLLRHKAAAAETNLEVLGETLLLQAGTAWPVLAALFWALAALGLAALLRRRRGLGVYSLLLVIVQWLAMAVVLRPAGVGVALILNRYLLPVLPVVLLWVAGGLVAIWDAGRRRRLGTAGAAATVLALGALAAGNPYAADPALRLGPFAGTNAAMRFYEPSSRLPPEAVAGVYRFLAEEPGGEAVVQAVPNTASHILRQDLAHWRLHRRPVVLATPDPWLTDPRLDFRTVVPAEPGAMARSTARFAVVQLDRPRLQKIELRVREGREVFPLPGPTPLRHGGVARDRALARELREAWGEPHLVSGDVLLWDLRRVRMRSRPATGYSPGP